MSYHFLLGDLRSAADATLLSPRIMCFGVFSSPVILSLLSVIFLLTVRFLQPRNFVGRKQQRWHTMAEVVKRLWPTYSLTKTFADPWAFEAVEEPSAGKRKKRSYHRRTSLISSLVANRQLLEKGLALKQNVINIIFKFESNFSKDNNENKSGDMIRLDFVQTMTTLATKYERMRSIPRFDVDERNGECVWCPIDDIPRFVDKCVSIDPMYDECGEDDSNERLVLQRAHKYVSEILAAQDESGQDTPLWRVIILSSKFALFRIDHCICDGVSAVSLLRDVGVKTSSKEPLVLEDLSPILRYFVRAGDLRIRMLPLKLLCWPPNLIRAIKFLVYCLTFPLESPNPLRPLPKHFGKPIPSEFNGTVYFPTMKVKLFQEMAKSVGSGTTINDILLLCVSIAFGSYFDHLGIPRSDVGGVQLILPIANPIPPSLYNDSEYGLRNGMNHVIVPLKLPSEEYTSVEALKDIQSYMMKVKQSNTPLLMSCINRLLQRIIPLEKIAETCIETFQHVSCVWSNVPGPFEAGNMYNIKKMQIVMPHPVSTLQVIAYDGNLFFNITLDLRSAKNPWFLKTAFVHAVKSVATATGVDKEREWAEELAGYGKSKEWGGDGIVYSSARYVYGNGCGVARQSIKACKDGRSNYW